MRGRSPCQDFILVVMTVIGRHDQEIFSQSDINRCNQLDEFQFVQRNVCTSPPVFCFEQMLVLQRSSKSETIFPIVKHITN